MRLACALAAAEGTDMRTHYRVRSTGKEPPSAAHQGEAPGNTLMHASNSRTVAATSSNVQQTQKSFSTF